MYLYYVQVKQKNKPWKTLMEVRVQFFLMFVEYYVL